MSWDIRAGDVMELLASLQPASVDAVVTDVPYGERAASWDRPRSAAWHRQWITLAHRALKPNSPLVTFCARRRVDVVMGELRRVRGDSTACPLQLGVWVHRQGIPVHGMLRPEHEVWIASGPLRAESEEVRRLRSYTSPHVIARKPVLRARAARGFKPFTYQPSEHGPIGGTVIEGSRNKPAEQVGHPTQKPESVVEYLVLLASEPGGLVLDMFCGSGTTGVVALRRGRGFLGFDLSSDYCEMARRRIVADAPLLNAPPAERVERPC